MSRTKLTYTEKIVISAFFIIIVIALLFFTFNNEKHLKRLRNDITSPWFIFSTAIVVLATFFGMLSKNSKINKATKAALIAFIIGYLSQFNLAFIIFFVVGIVAYYE
jgi:hypothetical protein